MVLGLYGLGTVSLREYVHRRSTIQATHASITSAATSRTGKDPRGPTSPLSGTKTTACATCRSHARP